MSGRRQFLRNATSNLAAFAAMGVMPTQAPAGALEGWDLTWLARLTGKRRAVFDVAEIESGAGVHRAAVWASQCVSVLGAAPADVSPVIVLRAHAVVLALHQPFWDRYAVGKIRRVTHPVTMKETHRNPVLMNETDAIPPFLVAGGLVKQLERGVTVLACNIALQAWVDAIGQRSRIPESEARSEVVAALIPGVILQPSGVLAAILAQEQGCAYIHAS